MMALILLAAFVIPSAFITANDAVDSEDQSDLLLSADVDEMEEYELPTNITTTITIPTGYYVLLSDDYIISEGAKIQFTEGSELRIDATMKFSIVARGDSGFEMSAGSMFAIGALSQYQTMTFDTDASIGLEGQFDYNVDIAFGKESITANMAMRVLDTSKIIVDDIVMEFNSDLNLKVNLTAEGDLSKLIDGDIVDASARISGGVNMDFEDIVVYSASIPEIAAQATGCNMSFDLSFSTPKYIGKDYALLNIDADETSTITMAGITMKTDTVGTLDLKVTFGESILDITFLVDGMIESETQFIDADLGDELELEDASVSTSLKFTDKSVNLNAGFDIGYLSMPITVEDEIGEIALEGLSVSEQFNYEYNSLADIFTVKNFIYAYMYVMNEFDPEDSAEILKNTLKPQLMVFLEGDETFEQYIDIIIDNLPEPILVPMGAMYGFIDMKASEQGVDLVQGFQQIYDAMEDKDFSDYMSLCGEMMTCVAFELDEYVSPVSTHIFNFTIDSLAYMRDDEGASINNVYLDLMERDDNKAPISEMNCGIGSMDCYFINSLGPMTLVCSGFDVTVAESVNEDLFSVDIFGDASLYLADYDIYIEIADIDSTSGIIIGDGYLAVEQESKIGEAKMQIGTRNIYFSDLSMNESLELYIPGITELDIIYALIAIYEYGTPATPEDPFETFALIREYRDIISEATEVPSSDIGLYIDAQVSAAYMEYSDDDSTDYDDAEITKASAKASYSLVGDDENFKAKMEMKEGDYVGHDITGGAYVDINRMEAEIDLISDDTLTFDVKGSFRTSEGESREVAWSNIERLELKSEYINDVFGNRLELISATADYQLYEYGLTFDFGKIKYDSEISGCKADKVNVSGISTIQYNKLREVKGYFSDVIINIGGPATESFTSGGYNFTATLENGSEISMEYDGSDVIKSEVTGEFFGDCLNGNMTLSELMTLRASGTLPVVEISGDGMFIIPQMSSLESYKGTVYVTDRYVTPTLNLLLSTHGCAFGVSDDGKMTLKALSGYELDPTSFEGFIDMDGYVVVDPEIIAEGGGFLIAEAIGESHVMTIDGVAYDIRFGDYFSLELDENFLFMIDSNGNEIGMSIENTWIVVYDFREDLVLTSVLGTPVTPVVDDETVVTSNDIVFTAPEEFDYFEFTLPNNITATFMSDHILPGSKAYLSIRETSYDGKEAYNISSTHPMYIWIPVDSKDAQLYHVINGTTERIFCNIAELDGQNYLLAYLDSYSTYYIDFEDGGYDKGYTYGASIVIVLLIVLVAAGYFHMKARAKN